MNKDTTNSDRATCRVCGKNADVFKDKISEREYGISMMCQDCQDKVFGPGSERFCQRNARGKNIVSPELLTDWIMKECGYTFFTSRKNKRMYYTTGTNNHRYAHAIIGMLVQRGTQGETTIALVKRVEKCIRDRTFVDAEEFDRLYDILPYPQVG